MYKVSLFVDVFISAADAGLKMGKITTDGHFIFALDTNVSNQNMIHQ